MRLIQRRIWRRRISPAASVLTLFVLTPLHGTTAFSTMALNYCNMERPWGVLEKISVENHSIQAYRLFMKDDGTFPNNLHYPTILLKSPFCGTEKEAENLIVAGGWTRPWAWGIFPYHHYHSTAWELLLCVRGQAEVKLGGETGPIVSIQKGDLVYIPPGFAHKQIESSGGFTLLGAYPTVGCTGPVDVLRGVPTARERANIDACVPPQTDPILGLNLSSMY